MLGCASIRLSHYLRVAMYKIFVKSKLWPSLFIPVLICAVLSVNSVQISQAQSMVDLPTPGTRMTSSELNCSPAIMLGMTLHSQNPLQFDFIIDRGDDHLEGEVFKKTAQKLISYFMTTLTIPEEEMWVNLSPQEEDRIIAEGLGQTMMGRDMLAQDYILKQITSSLMYPEEELGAKFWDRVYQQAQDQFGTAEVPTNTFNKVWIIPDKAEVYVNGFNVFVSEAHLKVMLEEDYLSLEHHDKGLDGQKADEQFTEQTKNIIREIIVPEIEKEVNQGKHFAPLRQIYHSMILATWYKHNLKKGLMAALYVNKNKIKGVDVTDKDIKNKIYDQYIQSFKRGVYNYVKEDYNPVTRAVIPRRYFSGGEDFAQLSFIQREGQPSAEWVKKMRARDHAVVRVAGQVLDKEGQEISVSTGPHDAPVDMVKVKTIIDSVNIRRQEEFYSSPKIFAFSNRPFLTYQLSGDSRNLLILYEKEGYLYVKQGAIRRLGRSLSGDRADRYVLSPMAKTIFTKKIESITENNLIKIMQSFQKGRLRARQNAEEAIQQKAVAIKAAMRSLRLAEKRSQGLFMTISERLPNSSVQMLSFGMNDQLIDDRLVMFQIGPRFYVRKRQNRSIVPTIDGFNKVSPQAITLMETPVSELNKNRLNRIIDDFMRRTLSARAREKREAIEAYLRSVAQNRSSSSSVAKGFTRTVLWGALFSSLVLTGLQADGFSADSSWSEASLSRGTVNLQQRDPVNPLTHFRFLSEGKGEHSWQSELFGFSNADRLLEDAGTDIGLEMIESDDSASVTSVTALGRNPMDNVGGIDFNANNMNLTQQGDVFDFEFDENVIRNIDINAISGIAPVIINISPMNTILPLLGLQPRIPKTVVAQSN